MKRILSLTVLLCAVAASALASAPESALKALTLGNEKYALEKTLEGAPAAIVVADPAIDTPVSDLFGLPESKLVVVKPEGEFGPDTNLAVQDSDLAAPLVMVLGLNENAVWTAYAGILEASPALIHAVLKGQVFALGAVLDAESGSVRVLGAHPELQTLVGQYLLGAPSEAAPEAVSENAVEPVAEDAPVAAESKAQDAAAVEEGHEGAATTVGEDAPPVHQEADAAAHAPEADADAQKSGGSGFMLVLLFVVALVGTVVFMDKTVLKS
ncbi:MAG: hypothetical protein AB7D27_01965 [Desulfomicrobium sp.]